MPTPVRKPDEHGAGEEVGEEPQSRDTRQEQEGRHQDGEHRGQGHVLVGPHRGEPDQTGGEDGRGGGVGAHHQVSR